MRTYRVGYFVGSLSSTSINRLLSRALIRLAPEDLGFAELPVGNLPLYSPDLEGDYPPEPLVLKKALARSDAVLFVTPEYNRSIPGVLKNVIDWASRPAGTNSFDHMPAAVIGALTGHRHRDGTAEPASGAELLQRPADDRARGLRQVHDRPVDRRR